MTTKKNIEQKETDIEKNLSLKNIQNIVAFKDWLKSNLTLYSEKQIISKVHLQKYVEYLSDKVRTNHLTHKVEWIKALDSLKEDIEKEEDK